MIIFRVSCTASSSAAKNTNYENPGRLASRNVLALRHSRRTARSLTPLAALKGAPTPVLKARWRELFETEPPAYNRRFLESRLAYRIQELAYGGLSRQTLERLRAMAKQYATRDATERKARPVQKPIAGTKLIREYQGVEHCVTVRADDFEYLGRPYKSLSSIAREITGTKWNGLVFFGLKRHPG